jgi:DNA-binding winged helix-turn-helix (wHTH) protein
MGTENSVRMSEEAQGRIAGMMLKREALGSFDGNYEGAVVDDSDRAVQAALWRVLESEGRQVTITFDRERKDISGFGSAQTAVVASILQPFGWDELVRRVSSMQGGTTRTIESDAFRFGDVRVDFSKMEVTRRGGQQVELTAQEFKLLKVFVMNQGRVLSRNELLNEAWGYDNYPCTRTVDNHILRLRQKLEVNPAQPVHFLSIIRVGYKFVANENPTTMIE